MNKILIIAIVFFLMFIFNKRENFVVESNEDLRKIKCDNTTELMSNVNMYVDKTCQDKDSTTRNANNNRLTCRNFVEKQIILGNDNKGYCGNDSKVPEKQLQGDFTGFNALAYSGPDPQPNNEGGGESDFPFDLDMVKNVNMNLDNKL